MFTSLKRGLCALVLTLAMAVPSLAADNGFYLGLKFLDSIQSTGSISKGGSVGSLFDVNDYTENTI